MRHAGHGRYDTRVDSSQNLRLSIRSMGLSGRRGMIRIPGVDRRMETTKTLSLVKGGHYYSFKYEVGQEAKVLDALVDMVHKSRNQFDWFDAAILSHQLGRHLAK